jgi:hypothetical protein
MFKNPERMVVEFRRLTPQQLRELTESAVDVISYIRHPATANLVSNIVGRVLEPNNSNYIYRDGDIVVIVTLVAPQRGQEATSVREEDIVIYQATIRELE